MAPKGEPKRRVNLNNQRGTTRENIIPNILTILYKKKKDYFIGESPSYFNKKKLTKRYYKMCLESKLNECEEEEKKPIKFKEQLKRTSELDENKLDDCLRTEQELGKKTEEFNKLLTKEPNNIKAWLEYIKFQDVISQFEKTYKGSGTKNHRLIVTRKLSILDKALDLNPDSNKLLREKYLLSDEIYPADHVSEELRVLLQKRPLNLILWRNLIDVRQSSIGQCTAPSVLELYDQAMTTFHKSRRGAALSTIIEIEDKIIQLLYLSGLFLRQAGLWEQLWTILKMYLDLNIVHSDPNVFNLNVPPNEEKLRESEDVILESRLPLSELWYRTEKLREGVHWLPCKSETEDPQRVVFNEDVSMLLHPITSESLSFKLVTMIISLLKVPLLPLRHTSCHHLGIFQPPWTIDSIEILLACAFPTTGVVSWNCGNFFINIKDLISGAQYLDENKLGHEEYLNFVIKLIQTCASNLKHQQRIALLIWWLRFERFLLTLHRYNIITLSNSKKISKTIKDFLKLEPNRNVILFYREYALIEAEMGKIDSAIKVLTTTINAQINSNIVLTRHTELCHLYRTLCQLLIGQNKTDQALVLLIALVLGQPLNLQKSLSTSEINDAKKKFHHISKELLADLEEENENELKAEHHFLPNFETEWITCHAWFLFLTESPQIATVFLKDILIKWEIINMDDKEDEEETEEKWTLRNYRKELLYESLITIVHWNCHSTYGSYGELESVLQEALASYPDNGLFLSTLANIETTSGWMARPWWQISHYFYKTESSLAKLFILFLIRQRKNKLDEASIESYKILNLGGPLVPDSSHSNRLGAMLSSLLEDPITRRCPIFWRIYIHFIYYQQRKAECDKAFYRAIEQCPWVKAFYLDAAKFVPSQIGQIQDLLIEKELRLHVTPEELDILREDVAKECAPTTSKDGSNSGVQDDAADAQSLI